MDEFKDTSYINCRRIRKEQKMSLKELAERSGLSSVYLSNYENGKANITIASLYAIAKALGTSVKDLLATKEEEESLLLVPREKRFSLPDNTAQPGSVIQEFLTRGSSYDMQVTVMHLQPHTNSGAPKTHYSDEFIYILQRTLTLNYNNRTYALREGDFAYYSAQQGHFWMNTGEEPVAFLAVASRNGF